MDARTAHILACANTRFYRSHAASFAQTRQRPWQGWEQLVPLCLAPLAGRAAQEERALFLLDIAAGNMRFGAFAKERLERSVQLEYHAVDNCPPLAGQAGIALPDAHFQELDVLECLLSGQRLEAQVRAPQSDLVACFGFFHHVPGEANRQELLESLLRMLATGGFLALSFWRFMDDDAFARKVLASQQERCERLSAACGEALLALDEGDYLLGWQNSPDAIRYCHSFSEAELDRLARVAAVSCSLVARYRADGTSGASNEYLVFRAQ